MALITPDDLALRLGGTLEQDRAQLACDLASAVVQSITGQNIVRAEHVSTLPVLFGTLPRIQWPTGHQCESWPTIVGVVDLPQRPVTDVANVAAWGVDLAATAWWWDGLSPSLYVEDPEVVTATVTYTAGYLPVPDEVKAAALALASDEYVNPSGVTQETIGSYSVTYGATGGPGQAGAIRTILARYSIRADSIRLDP